MFPERVELVGPELRQELGVAVIVIWGSVVGFRGDLRGGGGGTEAEEVDVFGESGGALGWVVDELSTRRAANGLRVPLGQVGKADLASRVPT